MPSPYDIEIVALARSCEAVPRHEFEAWCDAFTVAGEGCTSGLEVSVDRVFVHPNAAIMLVLRTYYLHDRVYSYGYVTLSEATAAGCGDDAGKLSVAEAVYTLVAWADNRLPRGILL